MTDTDEVVTEGPLAGRKHGETSTYNRGCRCAACRAAASAYAKEARAERARRFAAGEVDIPHGLNAYRGYGCRCTVCTEANTTATNKYKKQWKLNHPDQPDHIEVWRQKNFAHVAAKNRQRQAARQAETQARANRAGKPWSVAELATISRDELSTKEAAKLVGRSYASVNAMRQKLTVQQDGVEIKVHGLPGYKEGCRCDFCLKAKISDDKKRAQYSKRKTEALKTAFRYGEQWTGPELEIASRSDLSVAEVAAMIGRSYSTVCTMRWKLKNDPKTNHVGGIAADASASGSTPPT